MSKVPKLLIEIPNEESNSSQIDSQQVLAESQPQPLALPSNKSIPYFCPLLPYKKTNFLTSKTRNQRNSPKQHQN